MISFLRFVGLANAAVWFGATIFFTFVAGPAFFSEEMINTFSRQHEVGKHFAGLAAQVIIKRYFVFHCCCAALALAHLLAERFYLGRRISQLTLGLWIGIVSLTLIGGFWLQPKLRDLHQTMYRGSTAEQRGQASTKFRAWHGASQGANLLLMTGLLVYFWRLANPTDSGRIGSLNKFRG